MDAPEVIADVSTAEAPEIELDPEVEPASQTEHVLDSEQGPLNAVHGEDLKNGGDEKKWPGWPGENVFRILVPAHKVGGIIGKKGECIKKMCEESKSRIKILDGPHAAARSSSERASGGLPFRFIFTCQKLTVEKVIWDMPFSRIIGLLGSELKHGIIQRDSKTEKGILVQESVSSSTLLQVLYDDPKAVDDPMDQWCDLKITRVIISAKEEPDAEISPAMNGLLHVHKYIIDSLAGEATLGNTVKTRLLAPGTQARSLIGKQGSTIKSIQEASSSTVRIHEEVPAFALQDDKVIEIQGEPAGVHKAVELISGRLRKYLVDRSVLHLFESSMPMPNTQMEHMAPPPQSWGHPHALPPNVGSGFGAPPPFMPQRPHDNYYPPPELPPMEKSHHGVSAYGREPPSMGVHSANQPPPVLSQVTHHMQIPLSFADAVIGTSGASISYIRRTSGATITIQETRGVPGEMTVEINGSGTQVQTAQQLIQNFMAEAAAPAQNVAPPVDQGYNYQSHGGYMSGPANAGPGSAGGGYGSGYGTNYGY